MPEAKLAREAELCYATLALATDYDVWHAEHDAVTRGGGGREPAKERRDGRASSSGACCRASAGRARPGARRARVTPSSPNPRGVPGRDAEAARHSSSTATSRSEEGSGGLTRGRAGDRRDRHRQRARRRAEPRERRLPDRQGLAKGTMRLVDEARARDLYDAMGPGVRDLGRLGRQHDRRRGVVRRARALRRQGAGTTSSARCSPTTCARPASATPRRRPPPARRPAAASS